MYLSLSDDPNHTGFYVFQIEDDLQSLAIRNGIRVHCHFLILVKIKTAGISYPPRRLKKTVINDDSNTSSVLLRNSEFFGERSMSPL